MKTFSLSSGLAGNTVFSARSAKGQKKASPKLNLVSLMDIFTILVFFLMVNSGDVEVLQPDEKIVLPKSFAEIKPDSTPVVKINNEFVLLREEPVLRVDEIDSEQELIKALHERLLVLHKEIVSEKASYSSPIEEEQKPKTEQITVMGDAGVPYDILKKVLYTCAQADFRDVSLAVEYTTRPDMLTEGGVINVDGADGAGVSTVSPAGVQGA